jgi:hypothetical protein
MEDPLTTAEFWQKMTDPAPGEIDCPGNHREH